MPAPRRAARTLTLSLANVAAYETFDAAQPFESRLITHNLNRVWSSAWLDGNEDSVELRRAREMRPAVAEAEHILDIHSTSQDVVPFWVYPAYERNAAVASALPVKPAAAPPRRYKLLRTHVIQHEICAFTRPAIGFETFAEGELIATDGPLEIRALCDGCTIFMPARQAQVPIDHFDGQGAFENLPRDGRCVADYWF